MVLNRELRNVHKGIITISRTYQDFLGALTPKPILINGETITWLMACIVLSRLIEHVLVTSTSSLQGNFVHSFWYVWLTVSHKIGVTSPPGRGGDLSWHWYGGEGGEGGSLPDFLYLVKFKPLVKGFLLFSPTFVDSWSTSRQSKKI